MHCSLRTEPLEAATSACTSFLYRGPKVTSRRLQTLRSATLARLQLACPKPCSQPGEGASGTCSPWPLAYSCIAALPEPGEGASGTCSPCTAACHLGLRLFLYTPKVTCRRPQTLPSAPGLLLHRSLAGVRREPGKGASGTCSPRTAAQAPSNACWCQAGAWGGSLGNVQPVRCSLRTEPLEAATSACTSFL